MRRENWKYLKFEDAFVDVSKRGKKIPKSNYLSEGRFSIIDQGQNYVTGYSNSSEGLYSDVPALIFGDHTRIIKYVDVPFFLGADGVKLLKSKLSDVDYKFLYYVLSQLHIIDTGYNRHFKYLKEQIIPLPPLDEQKRIADVLDKASELINKRKEQIRLMDQLPKSLFIEMFGDPVENPMGWERDTLRHLAIRISDGPFGSNLKSCHYANSGVRVIRLQNIGVGKFLDKDKAFVSYEHYEKIKKYTCTSGDVIIATLGDPNLRACILHIDLAINKADCVLFRPNKMLVNSEFICSYLNSHSTLQLALDKIHGQTRLRISMSQVADLPVYLPPIELQQEFADRIDKVEAEKKRMQDGLAKMETTYKALMQEYFG